MLFKDRWHAGSLLARALDSISSELREPLVVAIPRGGVVVAAPIAQRLGAKMELTIPRKIGAPFNEEFAIGAVAEDGTVFLSPAAYRLADEDYIRQVAKREILEARRRRQIYRSGKKVPFERKDIILVDDGIATGMTVKAALGSLRNENPSSITLAVPVMPADRLEDFRKLVDRLVVLHAPEIFSAVGQFYDEFSQTSDEEVLKILKDYAPD